MKVLSIIIPSYNSEQFIDKNMAFFLDDRLYSRVEIIIINDGSKDTTFEKAKFYAEKYPGYVSVIDKENGGHGSGINCGIKSAQGKYFKVIDADDWVDTNSLVQLALDLEQADEDLVLNPYIKVDQNTGKNSKWGIINGVKKGQSVDFDQIKQLDAKLALHSVTIKTRILKDHGIVLTENCFYEDFEYTFYPIPYIKTCRLYDYPVYHYLVGQKTQSVNASSSLRNIDMYIRVMNDSIDYYESISPQLDQKTKRYMESCLSDFIRSMYNIFLRNWQAGNIYGQMLDADHKLKNKSLFFYNKVAENNQYIRLLRCGHQIIFKMIAVAFHIYKYKEVL